MFDADNRQLGVGVKLGDTGARAARSAFFNQRAGGRNVARALTDRSTLHKDTVTRRLRDVAAAIRLPSSVADDSLALLDRCIEEDDWGSGRWSEILSAACMYIAIRQANLAITVLEVADSFHCDVTQLGRMYYRVLAALDIQVPDVNPVAFLERAVSNLPSFQIAIRPEDQHKTAFQTRYGLYEFVVMPFGLCNRIFHDYLDKFVIVYLDDILIFSKTVEEHVAHLDKVLSLLRQHKFKINGEKCEFGRTRVLYLGHEISAEGLKPDDAKVASIRDWPRPQSVTEMRSFLGMTGYYRTFVKNYSIVAAPLTDLTRLDTPWEWTDECEAAFRHLKHALTHYEVLKLPDPDKPFIVTTDAIQYGISAVLAQQEGPKLRPVEYMSKKMPSQKLAKSTYEKELYSVTDHQTLRWMRPQPVLSDALKRWIEVIEQYDFDLHYLKGEYNKVADALSRRPDFSGALITEFDLTDDVTHSLVDAYREDQFMSENIRRLQAKDKKTSAEFELVNGLLFLEKDGNKRLCVPSSESLRSLFLGECHDATGHFGYKKTAANLLQRFWWPTMMRDAQLYVETCQVCQRDKPHTQAPLGLLKPLPIPERPGESLSMDFMDTLITSKSGMRHIFVIVDRFSKYARLIAMPETAKTEYVIRIFKENWVRDFGLPKSIVSDRDVRFTSELWKAAVAEQGTQLQMTFGNHPEANGQAEQLNRVVQHLLRHYIKPNQRKVQALRRETQGANCGVAPDGGLEELEATFVLLGMWSRYEALLGEVRRPLRLVFRCGPVDVAVFFVPIQPALDVVSIWGAMLWGETRELLMLRELFCSILENRVPVGETRTIAVLRDQIRSLSVRNADLESRRTELTVALALRIDRRPVRVPKPLPYCPPDILLHHAAADGRVMAMYMRDRPRVIQSATEVGILLTVEADWIDMLGLDPDSPASVPEHSDSCFEPPSYDELEDEIRDRLDFRAARWRIRRLLFISDMRGDLAPIVYPLFVLPNNDVLQGFDRFVQAEVQAALKFAVTEPQALSTIEVLYGLLIAARREFAEFIIATSVQQTVAATYDITVQQPFDLQRLRFTCWLLRTGMRDTLSMPLCVRCASSSAVGPSVPPEPFEKANDAPREDDMVISQLQIAEVDTIRHHLLDSASLLRELLHDDKEYGADMRTAANNYMPSQIRQVCAMLFAYGPLADPMSLFFKYREPMSEDYVRRLPNFTLSPAVFQALALLDIDAELVDMKTDMSTVGLSFPDMHALQCAKQLRSRLLFQGLPELIQEESAYDRDQLNHVWETNVPMLHPSQRVLVQGVVDAVLKRTPLCVFVDAPVGTGKTFCINTILSGVRRHEGCIALAVASSGIASLLLPGGRTFHSRFRAPLTPDDKKPFAIPKQSELATLIRRAQLIVWDEAPMTHRFHLEALDITLRDLCDSDLPFGGKVVLLAGDFRQVLPVVKRGSRAQQINACIKSSHLWQYFHNHKLDENMKVLRRGNDVVAFADFLLRLGNGQHDVVDPSDPEIIELPREICTDAPVVDLIRWTFPDLRTKPARDPCSILDNAEHEENLYRHYIADRESKLASPLSRGFQEGDPRVERVRDQIEEAQLKRQRCDGKVNRMRAIIASGDIDEDADYRSEEEILRDGDTDTSSIAEEDIVTDYDVSDIEAEEDFDHRCSDDDKSDTTDSSNDSA
ncbi:hypothetical protein CBR_g34074 [Chara braunii]|uniref:ATP-dependent DNA helicase n=1 Tax=Chara braunii TaxID=69332 RepID=A0A388LI07_CHABU|nr:hypothetical protein CBR_g34074 [Chara braunii]|eukprot:GBG81891.1 hypothetical protein CBR_g34074 [Chara braunii]